jgi:cytochrome c biogenesis factor
MERVINSAKVRIARLKDPAASMMHSVSPTKAVALLNELYFLQIDFFYNFIAFNLSRESHLAFLLHLTFIFVVVSLNLRQKSRYTRGVQKVLSLTYLYIRQINEYTFTFQHSHHLCQCIVYNDL